MSLPMAKFWPPPLPNSSLLPPASTPISIPSVTPHTPTWQSKRHVVHGLAHVTPCCTYPDQAGVLFPTVFRQKSLKFPHLATSYFFHTTPTSKELVARSRIDPQYPQVRFLGGNPVGDDLWYLVIAQVKVGLLRHLFSAPALSRVPLRRSPPPAPNLVRPVRAVGAAAAEVRSDTSVVQAGGLRLSSPANLRVLAVGTLPLVKIRQPPDNLSPQALRPSEPSCGIVRALRNVE